MIHSVKQETKEEAPEKCEGEKCTKSEFDYRPDFGVYACEKCYTKAMEAFMSRFE